MTDKPRPPAPPPPAQIAPFVQVLGVEGAIAFILTYGGAELIISENPTARCDVAQRFGIEAARALAGLQRHRRVPLAKPWLAAYFYAQGDSIVTIARRLRVSDVSVRGWLRRAEENRQRLAANNRRISPDCR